MIPLGIIVCVLARLLSPSSAEKWDVWVTLTIQIVIALLWLRFNHRFTVIRQRTVFPSLFFLLFCGANPLFFYSITASIVSFGIMLCLFSLYRSYQAEYTQDSSFNIALIIGVCSLLWPPVLFLIPVFWIGAYWFQAFNAKSFFASIIGILTVLLFVTAWSVYKNDWNFLLDQVPSWKELLFFTLPDFSLKDWIITALIILLMIISGMNFLLFSHQEKIRTRRYFYFLYIFAIYTCLMMIMQNSEKVSWAQIACLPCSMVVAHYFALVEKKLSLYLFIISIVLLIVLYCIPY